MTPVTSDAPRSIVKHKLRLVLGPATATCSPLKNQINLPSKGYDLEKSDFRSTQSRAGSTSTAIPTLKLRPI